MSVINVRTIYILKDQWDICLLLEFSCTLEKKKKTKTTGRNQIRRLELGLCLS